MTSTDTPDAGEALELVGMLHRASELAPLAKVDHINCDNAVRALQRFFDAADAEPEVAVDPAPNE